MSVESMSVETVASTLESRESQALERLMEWLRMPSIGTDPAYREQTRQAGQWCADQLSAAGFDACLRETGSPEARGNPIVWATNEGAADYKGPHVLFYGHYDVQPPDPLELWHSPPFEPVIVKGSGKPGEPADRIVARGACDDKGQVATFLEAMRAWKDSAGSVPVKFTVLIEGEEESGSANLEQFFAENRDALSQADICVISDTGMLERTTPGITYGLRGLSYHELKLIASDQDLHSGMWGGRCPNPNNELAKVLAQLWDENRKITIPGFYDDVLPITPKEKEAWSQLPLDQIEALGKIGLDADADIGEAGFDAVEREWARPACDVNGIWGGYTGAGAKTVIPSWAAAKVSFRLVANQDPEKIADAFEEWIRQRTPPGCRWEFSRHGTGHAGNVSIDSPYLQAARGALQNAVGKEPHLIKSGGSIPVVGMLKGQLGLDSLMIGFGLDDDRVHSPNEKFEIPSFRMGVRSHVHLVDAFVRMGK